MKATKALRAKTKPKSKFKAKAKAKVIVMVTKSDKPELPGVGPVPAPKPAPAAAPPVPSEHAVVTPYALPAGFPVYAGHVGTPVGPATNKPLPEWRKTRQYELFNPTAEK